jgi:EmrB/QacA subfamily drug resistance transporter
MTEKSPQPQRTQREGFWILVSVGISSFMGAMDGSIVNTVLPVMQEGLKSSIATIEWTVVIYLLVLSGTLLTFGRLGDLRGHKVVYVGGFIVFTASSVFCGLAPNAWSLILFRAVQAIGAGMLSANSPAILTKHFPANQRGRVLGLAATMTYLGLVVGPSLGGWLAEISWRWVFYINAPVGLLAVWLSLVYIPADRGKEGASGRFDVPGAVVFSTGLVALMLGLNQGHAWGWASPLTLGLLTSSLLLLIWFIWIERHSSSPMLDLDLFRSRNFSVTNIASILNYISIYTVIFMMPYYLIQGRGLGPGRAGLLLSAQPLVMVIAAPLSGYMSDRIGSRVPAVLGMFLRAIGMGMLAQIGAETSYTYIVITMVVGGLGAGIFISPNSSALMGSAPRRQQGIASGVMATSRNFGMVLGVGLAGAILTSLTAGEHGSGGLFLAIQVGFYLSMVIALAAGAVSLLQSARDEWN